LVFVPQSPESEIFSAALKQGVLQMQPQTMLTKGIAAKYASALQMRSAENDPTLSAQSLRAEGPGCAEPVSLFQSSVASLLREPNLAEEVFGPTTLLLTYTSREELLAAANALDGHLTATIHGTEEDLAEHRDLIAVLEEKVGRLLFNGFPTGVEVCHAMVHGGPYPATSDGRSTSVGTQAILRFARPFCYQDFPEAVLPAELQNNNPLGIMRMANGTLTRDEIE
jgi:NADP-dependent aldehyde dehydrogenase